MSTVELQQRYRNYPARLRRLGRRVCSSASRHVWRCHFRRCAQHPLVCARPPWHQAVLLLAGIAWVIFASEVRAILGSGCVRPTCDQTGLAHFIRFGSVSEPYTMFEDIESLPAGCWMEIRAGEVVDTKRFWRPDTLGEDHDHLAPMLSYAGTWNAPSASICSRMCP